MRIARAAPIVLAIGLAACQPASRGRAPAPPAGAGPGPTAGQPAARTPRAPDRVIIGEATYRERVKMPPGAALVVELVALDGAPRVVATVRTEDVAGPPIPFALPYDPARSAATSRHALRSVLLGPDGVRWFATPAPVPIVPAEGASVRLLLRRVDADPVAAAPIAASDGPRHWECGDLGVMTRRLGGGLRIDANARAWRLRPVAGDAYADAAGTLFREAAATAQLAIDGERARDCVPARQPSPWNAALLRGVAFRAVGNEPGWFVEVDAGVAPRLRATLDSGDRRLDLDARRSPTGFSGTAGREPLRLDIERSACTDGMSGQRFEASVTLQVGAARYAGCGGWLVD